MTDARLAELEAIAQAAMEGPWETDGWEVEGLNGEWIAETDDDANATFIAASRYAIPELIAELRHFRHYLRAMIDECGTDSQAGFYAKEALETAERGEYVK